MRITVKKKILLPVLTMLFFSFNCAGQIKDKSIIVYNTSEGLLSFEGKKSKSINANIPKNLIPVDFILDDNSNYYLSTLQSGIFRSDGSGSWENIAPIEFKRRTTLDDVSEFRKISSFDVFENKIIAATKHSLYLSVDKGKTWSSISLSGIERGEWRYFTAVTLFNDKPVAGTATNGIFLKSSKFKNISKGLPEEPTNKTSIFYESISKIAIHKNKLYAGFYFGKGIFMSPDSGKSWIDLKLPLKNKDLSAVHSIKFSGELIYAGTSEGIFYKNLKEKEWKKHSISETITGIFNISGNLIALITVDDVKLTVKNDISGNNFLIEKTNAADKKAIYTSVWTLNKKSGLLLETMKKTGINSIVIDLKDDNGNFFMDTADATANEIRAVNRKIDMKKFIKFFHDNGIYVIARMVVFKDKQLYNSYNNKYAIWDSKTKQPWKGSVVHEFWCDPYSKFVQNYNIALAKEAENAGFDEIQFDYIRFPTDGSIFRCEFRHAIDKDAYKSESLADFLQKAQSEISIPISTDIYGFNAWYNFGNIMGQDIEIFSLYVDAISPMMYPSHYGNKFYAVYPQTERPYEIVYHNSIRARYLSSGRVRIRPYIQAFNLLSPTWGPGYINSQLKAVEESETDGFIFWNAAGEYNMLIKAAEAK